MSDIDHVHEVFMSDIKSSLLVVCMITAIALLFFTPRHLRPALTTPTVATS